MLGVRGVDVNEIKRLSILRAVPSSALSAATYSFHLTA
jgi:hypothetical protein